MSSTQAPCAGPAAAAALNGGIATVYVSDLDRAYRFYTDVLGLKAIFFSAGQWGQVKTEDGFSIGLHPSSPKSPKPGLHGSISIGFLVPGPIEHTVMRLQSLGVAFRGPVRADGPIRLAFFADPDGNDLYLASYS